MATARSFFQMVRSFHNLVSTFHKSLSYEQNEGITRVCIPRSLSCRQKGKKAFYTEAVECSGYDLVQNNLTMEQSDCKTDCL